MVVREINATEFQKITQQDKPVLVDFWAPWCSYCRRIDPAYERIAQEYTDKLEAVKINIDSQPLVASQQGIDTIPTLVLYRDGQAIGSIVAPDSKAVIEAFIIQTLKDKE